MERDVLQAGYRYALSLCAEQADAEDLVQDAWVRLRRNRGHDAPGKSLFFTVIRNLHIDRCRRRKLTLFEPLVGAEDAVDAPDQFIGVGAARDLEAPLASLRPEEREALFLQVVEGYTAEEIAELTGRARGTVLSLVHRAKRKLRRAMADGVRRAS